jgi:hypothetical protein
MKNLFLLLFALLIISCSDSEEENFNLVGEWSRPMILVDGDNIIDDCQIRDTFDFKSNGIFIGVYYYYNNNGICEEEDFQNSTWELSGNTLIIDGDSIVIINIIDNNTFEIIEDDDYIEVFTRI